MLFVLILGACAPAATASTEAPAATETPVATATDVPPTTTLLPTEVPNALIRYARTLGATDITIHESGTRALLATPTGLYELQISGSIVRVSDSTDIQNPGYTGEYIIWYRDQGKTACYGDGLPNHWGCTSYQDVFGGFAEFRTSEFFVIRNTLYADGDNIEEGALSGKQEIIDSLVGNITPDYPLVAAVDKTNPDTSVIRVYDGANFEEITPWRLVGTSPVWARNHLYFVGTVGVLRAADFWGEFTVELECAGEEIHSIVLSPEENITYITNSGDVFTCTPGDPQLSHIGNAKALIGFWGSDLIIVNTAGELEAIHVAQ